MNMKRNTSVRTRVIVVAVLLMGAVPVAKAAPYRVQDITKADAPGTSYTILGGNQYFNDAGQVTGILLNYSNDKVYSFGPRGFVWSPAWQPWPLQALDTLGRDALGYGNGTPAAMNDKGVVAGTSTLFLNAVDQGPRPVAWAWGALAQLKEDKQFVSGNAVAINAGGSIAGFGEYYDHGVDKGSRALLWTDHATLNLGTFGTDPNGSASSAAAAINANNAVAGYSDFFDSSGNWFCQHAFLWTAGHLQDLGTLGTDPSGFACSAASAINANNAVVGTSDYYDSNGNWSCVHAFLWAGGSMKNLGTLGTDPNGFACSFGMTVNASNQVLGISDYYDGNGNWSGQHGFLWAGGTMTDLGALGVDGSGFTFSTPNAANDVGQVVGTSSYSENGVANGNRAFLYQAGAMLDLNTLLPAGSGLLLENALAVNNAGQIVAFGTRTQASNSYNVYILLSPSKK